MAKTATDQSQIQCTLGTTPQKLIVTSQQLFKVHDSFIATQADKGGLVNIPSFGNCKRVWYQPACVPSPIEWTGLSEINSILGNKQLLVTSTCQCSQGGKISFMDTSKNSFVDSE